MYVARHVQCRFRDSNPRSSAPPNSLVAASPPQATRLPAPRPKTRKGKHFRMDDWMPRDGQAPSCRHPSFQQIAFADSPRHFEVHSAGRHFAAPIERCPAIFVPTASVRCCSGPHAINSLPAHGLLLCPETCVAEETAAIAVSSGAAVNDSEYLCLFVSTKGQCIWTSPWLGFSEPVFLRA